MKVEIREGFSDIEVYINCPRATEEVQRVAAVLRNEEQKLSGVRDGQTHMIDRREVLYFESVDKRSFIYTADDTYETPLKLYEIEERLTELGFFRSSKAQIINIAKIASLCPDFGGRLEVVLENGERATVSRQYAKPLRERLGLK